MTDQQPWQSPDSGPRGAGAPPAGTGPYGPPSPVTPPPPPPGAVPPGAGAASAGPGAAPGGWAPPPKPGLVPLRPMTLGTILAASFQVIRRNPRPTVGPAILINLATFLIVSLSVGAITAWSILRIEQAQTAEDAEALAAGSFALVGLGTILSMLLSVVGMAILQGIVVAEVARGTVGEKLPLRGLWALVKGRVGALLGWSLLLALALAVALVAVGLLVAVVAALLSFLGVAGIALGIVLFLVLGLGVVALAGWLSTKLLFVPAAIVLERRSVASAVRRSWTLVVGWFWRTFGIMLLVVVMLSIASSIVSAPVNLLFTFGGFLVAPTGGDPTVFLVVTIVGYVVTFLVTSIIGALTLVIQSATSSLLYLDLRMRTEGLDLELARYVEARDAGAEPADPYAPRDATPPGA